MSDRTALTQYTYLYDGSLDGLLCCIFESFNRRETPAAIQPKDAIQPLLYHTRDIVTIAEHANRVYASIPQKLGNEAEYLIKTAFLSSAEDKELAIYRFIRLGYQIGKQVVNLLGHEVTSRIHDLVKTVNNEWNHFIQFLRFSEYDGNLVAVIRPKHFVLPLMQPHFCDRFPEEHFMIYDETYGMALVYQPYKSTIIPVAAFVLPDADETELQYRQLWSGYFENIAIKERANARCQMNFMPKRFWVHMTEMNPQNKKKLIASDKRNQLPAG